MKKTREGGMVLIVVLLLLLAISLLGVSSLKTGLFNLRMVGNTQFDVFALQAAESAINQVLIEAQKDSADTSFFAKAVSQGKQINCLSQNGLSVTNGYCGSGVRFGLSQLGEGQSLGQLQAFAVTEHKGMLPVEGYDVEQFSFHVFDTTGVGFYTGQGQAYAYANTQRWKRFGTAVDFDRLLVSPTSY